MAEHVQARDECNEDNFEKKMPRAAIGFRVKSGWAIAVLLAGPLQSPHVLDRRIVDLSDPNVPESRQPFHSTLELHQKAGEKVAAKLRKVVERYTKRSITKLIKDYRKSGHDFDSAGLVVDGSWRSDDKTATLAAWLALATEGNYMREER